MVAGYYGEADLLPPYVGGKGMTPEQVHVTFLSHFVEPVGVLVIIALLGVIVGLISYFSLTSRRA